MSTPPVIPTEGEAETDRLFNPTFYRFLFRFLTIIVSVLAIILLIGTFAGAV
jgi:hypothetical protein